MTHEQQVSIAQDVSPEAVYDHDCPYADRVDRYKKRMGERAAKYFVTNLSGTVDKLHDSNTCPPTHINSQPTREWSDILDATAY